MSLILDALNRSRQETDDVPTLGTRHGMAGDYDRRSARWPLIALAVSLVVIGGLVWDRQHTTAPERAPVSQSTEGVQVKTDEKSVSADVQQLAVESTEPTTAEPAPQPLAQPSAQPAAEPSVVSSSGPAGEAVVSAADTSAVSALYSDRQPAVKAAPAPEPAAPAVSKAAPEAAPVKVQTEEQDMDIESLVRNAEEELENARLAEHPAPFVNSLSQLTKDSIPTLLYQQHNYSGRAGQSRVVLNGKELAERGKPASGVEIVEILPDSVVLDYRGTQFRLRALNSWVNL